MTHSKWPHFTMEELTCPCGCGEMRMDDDFMEKVEFMRTNLGFQFVVTSGYRCPDYNDKIAKTGRDGPHTTGRAMDIHVYGDKAMFFIDAATVLMNGVGVKQHGEYRGRFIHIDDLDSNEKRTRPWVWSYA